VPEPTTLPRAPDVIPYTTTITKWFLQDFPSKFNMQFFNLSCVPEHDKEDSNYGKTLRNIPLRLLKARHLS
jgi:hypothetical protein